MENEAADRLYTVPPARFVAERSAAVAAARTAGDRAGAAQLAKLRRPSLAAWLTNLLALRRPELVGQLAELAEALRAAQRRLDGAQLRELASQRRATVAGLVAQARALAVAADPGLAGGKLPLAEVESTLHAALADPEVAVQVAAGRLVRPVAPAGFGQTAPPLRLVTDPSPAADEPDEPAEPASQPPEQARAQAETALGQARAAASAASAALTARSAAQQAAQQELAEVDAALDELMARRSDIAERLAEAEQASFQARRSAAEARQQVEQAQATLAELTEREGEG